MTASTRLNSSPRVFGPVRLAVLAGLIALVIWRVDLSEMVGYLTPQLLLAALLLQPLVLCGYAFSALRFVSLLGEHRAPFAVVSKAIVLAGGLNLVLPGRLSELLKVTYLRDQSGIPAGVGLAAVFLERVIDVIILGLLASLSAGLLMLDTGPALIIAMIAALLMLACLSRFDRLLLGLSAWLPWESLRALVAQVNAHLVARLRDRSVHKAFGYGLCIWLVAAANVALFIHLTGSIPIGLSGAFLVFVASAVGGAIPALPGGFGTYEAAVVFALKGYGYSLEEALSIALSMHVGLLWLATTMAGIIAARERLGLSSLLWQTWNEFRGR